MRMKVLVLLLLLSAALCYAATSSDADAHAQHSSGGSITTEDLGPVAAAHPAFAAELKEVMEKVGHEVLRQTHGQGQADMLVLLEPERPNRFGADDEVHVFQHGDKLPDLSLLETTARSTTHTQETSLLSRALVERRHRMEQQQKLVSEITKRFGPSAVKGVKHHWLVNGVSFRAGADVVSFLAQQSNVRRVELASPAVSALRSRLAELEAQLGKVESALKERHGRSAHSRT